MQCIKCILKMINNEKNCFREWMEDEERIGKMILVHQL